MMAFHIFISVGLGGKRRLQIVLANVFKQAQSYIDSNGLAGMKAKSSIQILFFEKQGKIQLLNSNIPRRARTARYGNKKKHKTR